MKKEQVVAFVKDFFESKKKKYWRVEISKIDNFKRVFLRTGEFSTSIYVDVEDDCVYMVLDCTCASYCDELKKIGYELAEELSKKGIIVRLRGDFWLFQKESESIARKIKGIRNNFLSCERIIVEL